MTIQEIKRLSEATPFQPFRVQVAGGNEYEVRHPEVIAQNPSGQMISIGLDDDSFITLDLLLVTGIRTGIPTPCGGRPKSR